MNKDQLIITGMNSAEFSELVQDSVEKSIQRLFQDRLELEQAKSEKVEELLSRKDVAKIYNVSYVTLRDWEKNNIIPKPIRKGTRVYWRKADIMNDINRKGASND